MTMISSHSQYNDSEHDLAALQGSWGQIDLESDGMANPPDEHSSPGALTTFTGNHFVVRAVDGNLLLEGDFTIDATTTPKSITWIDSMGSDMGKRLPASYKLDGDHFIFIAGDERAPRPIVFRTTPGQTMRTFVRRR